MFLGQSIPITAILLVSSFPRQKVNRCATGATPRGRSRVRRGIFASSLSDSHEWVHNPFFHSYLRRRLQLVNRGSDKPRGCSGLLNTGTCIGTGTGTYTGKWNRDPRDSSWKSLNNSLFPCRGECQTPAIPSLPHNCLGSALVTLT